MFLIVSGLFLQKHMIRTCTYLSVVSPPSAPTLLDVMLVIMNGAGACVPITACLHVFFYLQKNSTVDRCCLSDAAHVERLYRIFTFMLQELKGTVKGDGFSA